MKRYFTTIFLILSVIILMIGYRSEVPWSGIVSWALVLICLIFSAYFTKYIPDKKKKD